MSSTEPLFFDTDCLSAFLWIKEESIVTRLYPGRVVIPQAVYSELSNPCVPHLKARIDLLLATGRARVQDIDVGTPAYAFYKKLIIPTEIGQKVIGRGEAEAITLAREYHGILASNNLRDVSPYVQALGLQHKTTGDILKDALLAGMITEEEGNGLWETMRKRKRKLGYDSFTEFLKSTH